MYGIIYCIKNTVNSHLYIGQTTRTLERRIGEHFSFSNTVYSKNRALYSAITKYGKENFISYKIDEAESQEELDTKETYWIAKENSFLGKGYNCSAGGQVEKKNHANADISNKLSEILGGKEFMIFDIEGKYIKSMISQTVFAEEIGCGVPTVNNCLSERKPQTKGYILIYTINFTEEKLQEIVYRSRKHYQPFAVLNSSTSDWIGIWENKQDCADSIKYSVRSIQTQLREGHIIKREGKFICKYIKDCSEEELIQINKTNNMNKYTNKTYNYKEEF